MARVFLQMSFFECWISQKYTWFWILLSESKVKYNGSGGSSSKNWKMKQILCLTSESWKSFQCEAEESGGVRWPFPSGEFRRTMDLQTIPPKTIQWMVTLGWPKSKTHTWMVVIRSWPGPEQALTNTVGFGLACFVFFSIVWLTKSVNRLMDYFQAAFQGNPFHEPFPGILSRNVRRVHTTPFWKLFPEKGTLSRNRPASAWHRNGSIGI